MSYMSDEESPFVSILAGDAVGEVLVRDDARRFALVKSMHPEGAIHWLAIPYEPIASIEELEKTDRARFLELVEFAITQTQALAEKYPLLERGFTIKFHFGGYETVPHAKLHVLSVE
ncbi:MAG TPA: hypothetical protein PLD25_24620 [Chloroflexota bacterium]|nr:hypothetical protein [Chloroflexota bacterium]HUM72451.1 hypothetical protein [Chloroflexota bacterium]